MYRSRARIATLFVALALVVGVLPGTGGIATAQSGPVTIQLAAVDQTNKFMDTFVIPKFEAANPNIKVELAKYPAAQYSRTVRAQLTTGSGPDVFMAMPGHSDELAVLTVADANLIENLAGEAWAKSIPDEYKPTLTKGKKVFSHPIGYTPFPVFYNKQTFSANGIQVPKTFSDFLGACKTFSGKGLTPIAMGGAFAPAVNFPAYELAASLVDPGFSEQLEKGKTTFAKDKGWKAALTRYDEMNKAGCFGENPVATPLPAANTAIATGTAGMYIFGIGSNITALKTANPALQLGFFPLPAPKAADTRLARGAQFVPVISTASDEKAAAKKFVAFMVKNQKEIATQADLFPVDGAVPAFASDLAPVINSDNTGIFYAQRFPNPEVATALSSGIQNLLLGRGSVSDVLAAMDTAAAQS